MESQGTIIIDGIVNASYKATNGGNEAREYEIVGEATYRHNVFESLNNGEVRTKTEPHTYIANFSIFNGSGLSINFQNENDYDTVCAVISEVNAYINELKSNSDF